MASKPWKFGILYRSLNDSEFPLTLQIHACAGKPEAEPTEDYVRSPKDVALRNLKKYEEGGNDLQGRQLQADRGFTCYELVKDLETQFKMTFLGTIQANRKGLPKSFTATEGRPVGDYMVLYEENSNISIHSEIFKNKTGLKNVMFMTSAVPVLARTNDDTRRTFLNNVYNFTMGGTDRVDQMMSSYSCRFKSRRWTMNFLAYAIDTARVNARTINMMLREDQKFEDSRVFGFAIARGLVTPHILRRQSGPGIQIYIKKAADAYLGKFLLFTSVSRRI